MSEGSDYPHAERDRRITRAAANADWAAILEEIKGGYDPNECTRFYRFLRLPDSTIALAPDFTRESLLVHMMCNMHDLHDVLPQFVQHVVAAAPYNRAERTREFGVCVNSYFAFHRHSYERLAYIFVASDAHVERSWTLSNNLAPLVDYQRQRNAARVVLRSIYAAIRFRRFTRPGGRDILRLIVRQMRLP